MKNNNFILRVMDRSSKQILKSYSHLGIANGITDVRYHLDDGCPGCEVAFSENDRIDKWHWKKIEIEGKEPMNNWVKVGSVNFDGEDVLETVQEAISTI